MSEYFEQGSGIKNYLDGVTKQVEALHARKDIPQGNHIDMVLGMADIGGEYGSVILHGDQGSGKSSVAAAILGSESMIDIGEDDTAENLLGYEKPGTDERVYAAGKIGALMIKSEGDIRITLDELGQISNARPLHRLWNGVGFYMHDGSRFIDTSSMSVIATTNYPNARGGVYPIHKELRSRFGGGLALENPEIASPVRRQHESGLVAPTKVRQDLRDYMEARHPEGKSANPFTNLLVDRIAETGLFEPLSGDSRMMGGLLQSVRAKRLVTSEEHPVHGILTASIGREITKTDIADLAAFNLGKMAELTNQAVAEFSRALGGVKLTEHEKAVISRRFIAGIAKKTLLESFDRSKLGMTNSQIETSVKEHIDNTSYATSKSLVRKVNGITRLEMVDQVIMDKLFNGIKTEVTSNGESNDKSRLRDRISRRRTK